MAELSLSQARRVALAAQGLADPAPTGRVDRRHLRRVLARTHLLQLDSVDVFARAHLMPVYSRLGPYDPALLHDALATHREVFEYWGHEASLLPVGLHPLLRWRMARAAALTEGWGDVRRVAAEQPGLVAHVLARVEERGPVAAGELREGARTRGPMWARDDTKTALEHLFWAGRVTTSSRRGFERVYDLTERVLPASVLALPTPDEPDAHRALVALAARAHGVATTGDLRDYFRLGVRETEQAVRELAEDGTLLPARVQGCRRPAWLHAGAARPRKVRASALLSPFDPLVWARDRTRRLWGVDYRLEIYVPAAQRVHGYYVLPFLHDEAIAARVDLKADRPGSVLRVLGAWLEPGGDPGEVATALAVELRRAAAWRGLSDVVVGDRGDLAAVLSAVLRS